MELNIDTEQQAAVSILFSCVMQNGNISEQEIEQLSKAVVLCSKFRGFELNELTRNAISLQASHNTKDILEHCAGFISEDFRETLFAMVSEVILMDGHIDDEKTKTFAMLALYLNIPMERMKMILATYLIRNKWNVQVVDTSDN
ncbi:MAG TPA: hypothetical protein VFQ73_10755 [Flavisolibacter sp.]|nr:hypothetical protein [Flavisolibacter sp.]